ncbi:3-ketoacyl-CoA synthase 2 [Coccomyxa sp. Obi]|nr:3-ketoacyl-CoA synthase 2 [Coccomyxa sp. Obi]
MCQMRSEIDAQASNTGSRQDEERRSAVLRSWTQLPGLKHAVFLAITYVVVKYMGDFQKSVMTEESLKAWETWTSFSVELRVVPAVAAVLAVIYGIWNFLRSRRRVFLLDFACYKPPENLKVGLDDFMKGSKDSGAFTEESLEFQRRISQRNGLGEETYLPPALHMDPPKVNMENAREEARMVLFGAVQEVLDRTGLAPRDIDIIVVNCSLFNPTPSLSAMIVNHFKMRGDIISYNLAGMGCSAGVIAIGLAERILRTEPGKYALVVSTENITQNWYLGDDRSMLIPNTLFRMGGAAMVLTNRISERWRAKYELQHVVRVHLGADDTAYECVYQREDEKGAVGVELNRDLVKVAGKALEKNMTRMGPLVLPMSEQLRFAANFVARKAFGLRDLKPYVPNFTKAFDHFCLHAGGRGVIEGLGGQLGLSRQQVEPSFNSLYWYGNTSSGSLWYALSYIEAAQSVRKGEVVWQVGFGSGFKCNSAVWKATRHIHDSRHAAWAHLKKPGNLEKAWQYVQANASPSSKYSAKYGQPVEEHANGHAHHKEQDPKQAAQSPLPTRSSARLRAAVL